MGTSLQQQLLRLAAPQTDVFREQRRKVSILFDPKEAATLDRQTFLDIGLCGLEELKKLNWEFEQFEATLFDVSSKEFQRAVQTTEVNQKLDLEITKFFYYLSPYFLSKCAHQALEWLVQRFQVQSYNVDQLMMLILPYHETNIFVRVLQIIQLKDLRRKWHWLHPLQNAGVPLSKTTLLNHCASNTSFLSFVCQMPISALQLCGQSCTALNTLCTFTCMTVIGALDYSKNISEIQVSHILKLLIGTLNAPYREFACMSIVITAQLSRTTKLQETILSVLVNKLSKVPHESLEPQCCAVLSLLYFNQQETLNRIPDTALNNFAKSGTFIISLKKIIEDGGDVSHFLIALIKGTAKKILQCVETRDDLRNFMESLLISIVLDDDDAQKIITTVIECYIFQKVSETEDSDDDTMDVDDTSDNSCSQTHLQWYTSFLKSLERQYAAAFDLTVKKILETTKDERKRKSLLDILGFMPKVNFQILGVDMFQKLHHPSATMRIEGIRCLLANCNKLREEDKDFVQNVLRNRLQEDSYKVVQAVLECPVDILASLVGEEFFVSQMIEISVKFWQMSRTSGLKSKIVAYLCSSVTYRNKETAVLFAVLPYLLPKDDEALEFANCVLQSQFSKTHKFMLEIKKELQNCGPASMYSAEFLCFAVSKAILNKTYIPNISEVLEIMNEMPVFKSEPVFKFIATILISASISSQTDVEMKWKVMDTVLKYYSSCKVNNGVSSFCMLDGKTMQSCMQMTFKKELPVQALIFCLQNLSSNTVLSEEFTSHNWWNIASMNEDIRKENSIFFIKLFEVLIVGCMDETCPERVRGEYIGFLKKLFKGVFPNLQMQLGFLSNLWIAHEFTDVCKDIADSELQMRSLLLARSLLLKTEESIGWTMDLSPESIIPPLLISLSCPLTPIRLVALECFAALKRNIGTSLNEKGYNCLVKKLLDFEEELKLDSEQISVVLYKLLSPDPAIQAGIGKIHRNKLQVIMDALFDIIVRKETPLHIRNGLLKILSLVNSEDIMKKLTTVGKEILSFSSSNGNKLDFYRSAMLKNIFMRYENNTYSSLTKFTEVWDLFQEALFDFKTLVLDSSKTTYPSIIAMNQISKDLFETIPSLQQNLLGILLTVATEAEVAEVVSMVGHVVKRIVLDCKCVVLELEKMKSVQCPPVVSTLRTKRGQNKTNHLPPELLKTKEWREGTTLLELIQNKKKLRSPHLLFPVLFGILKRCLDFEEQAPVEYIKQLILSCILYCCQKVSTETDIDEAYKNDINVELVVQCIRASQNPQTHHHALLVLSQLAGMIPEQVLHNIMAIFTFMGSSILRQDDSYSFQIISKVVDTVIPILVKANDSGVDPDKLFDPVASVLRVFVDALVDIPEHRQMALFHKLMVTLGAENFMWLLMSLVIESHVHQRTSEQNKDGFPPKKLQFIVNVTLKFHPLVAIKNSIRLLEYLQSLPVEKDQKERKNVIKSSGCVTKLFNIANSSRSQFHHFKYAIIVFLSGMMGDSNFINTVAALSPDDIEKLELYFAQLIEGILQHIQACVRISEMNAGKPTAKFWKCMLNQSYELLDNVNALLLSDMFLHVILILLSNPIHTVRRRAMELLNARLQNEEFFNSCKKDNLLSLINPLLSIIHGISEDTVNVDEQLNQQTALTSVKILARLLASENTEVFGDILAKLTSLIKRNEKIQGNVLASALLCGAELCSCLQAFAVVNLPKFMPTLLKVLKREKKTENPDVVLLAIVTSVYKVVESLPHFLSPYLESLLLEISTLSSWFLKEESQKIAPIVTKLELVRQKLSSEVPLRVLVPVVNNSYFILLERRKYGSLGPLMDILACSFVNVTSSDFNQLRTELSNFFITALQFRSDNSAVCKVEEVESVESYIIKALVALVLKLSETSFRPLYYNLYHWATAFDIHKERLITFYRVSHSIAECLKGLFVLFAGHFIKNAATLLDETNASKTSNLVFVNGQEAERKNLLLLEAVLKTLSSIFLYDSAQFLNKERFDSLMQPLVDQLGNTLGGPALYKERALKLLSPCIVQFAVVTADDSLWKQLNYQILLKTRHSNPLVRLMSLETIRGIASKLGEDFLPQLPETVPFLAELMEDEEEEVEAKCVKVVQEIEEVLGEPLKKYF